MTAKLDVKAKIAHQFSKAAGDYDNLATLQAQVSRYALGLHSPCDGLVLDLGCGTGRITAGLADKAGQVLGLDIAEGMIRVARQRYPGANIHFYVADAENLPLADGIIDSVFSSMALQWCRPLNQVLDELYRVMQPGACGTLALMVKDSLPELHQSWQALGETAHVNEFESEAAIVEAAVQAGFRCRVVQHCFTSWHKNIFEVLHSIKDIGASVLTNRTGKALSRNQLLNLEACYHQAFAQDRRLPLSYQIGFLRIQK